VGKTLSKKFCLLRQGFSEAEAVNCERRHRHISLREVRELEDYGSIEFLDLHPISKRARYIELDAKRFPGFTQIGRSTIAAAAGAYKIHRGEIKAAQTRIEEYGKENREFLGSGPREIVLPGLKWNDQGIVGHFASDGGPAWFEAQIGHPVKVILRPRIPEAKETALHWRRCTSPPKLLRAEIKKYLRDRKAALARVDYYWPEICEEILAGPYSEGLNSLRASELPSMIFDKILTAYLCS